MTIVFNQSFLDSTKGEGGGWQIHNFNTKLKRNCKFDNNALFFYSNVILAIKDHHIKHAI